MKTQAFLICNTLSLGQVYIVVLKNRVAFIVTDRQLKRPLALQMKVTRSFETSETTRPPRHSITTQTN